MFIMSIFHNGVTTFALSEGGGAGAPLPSPTRFRPNLGKVELFDTQGRISNIGKLGMCLGRQLYRGAPTKK